MTEIPEWIDIDEEADSNKDVQNQHFIKVFVESDRPFLSRSYVQEEVGLSDEATRLRLGKLVERGLLGTDEIAGANVYWLKHPESNWPVPPDVEVESKSGETTVSELLDRRWVHFVIAGSLILLFGGTLIGLFTFLVAYSVSTPLIQRADLLVWGVSAIIVAYGLFVIALAWWAGRRYPIFSN